MCGGSRRGRNDGVERVGEKEERERRSCVDGGRGKMFVGVGGGDGWGGAGEVMCCDKVGGGRVMLYAYTLVW